jgi:hypothetical protein
MIDFSQYQHLEVKFNQRYGTNFRYSDFETQVKRNQYMEENFASTGSKLSEDNKEYIERFVKLFDKAFTNSVDRKVSFFLFDDILKDYNELMAGYREACEKQGEPLKQEWVPNSRLAKEAWTEMQDVEEDRQKFIEEEYLSRNIRIRDMRQLAEFKRAQGDTDPQSLSVIWNYANALQKVNDNRPRWWRVIHFVRNGAEQREAEKMRNLVTERLSEYDRTHGEGKGMAEMQRYLIDGGIMRLKYSIKDAVVNLRKQENSAKKPEALNNKTIENAQMSNQHVEEKEIILDSEEAKERIGNMLEDEFNEKTIEVKPEERHEEKNPTANNHIL